ncbi:hypothetical protein pb186bvf_005076 [Paramecium bursaria]
MTFVNIIFVFPQQLNSFINQQYNSLSKRLCRNTPRLQININYFAGLLNTQEFIKNPY